MLSLITIKRYCVWALLSKGIDVSSKDGLPYLAELTTEYLEAMNLSPDIMGDYCGDDCIYINTDQIDGMQCLMETITHEMCHWLLDGLGLSLDEEHQLIEDDIECIGANELQMARLDRCCHFIRRYRDISDNEVHIEWIRRFAKGWRNTFEKQAEQHTA